MLLQDEPLNLKILVKIQSTFNVLSITLFRLISTTGAGTKKKEIKKIICQIFKREVKLNTKQKYC